MEVLLVRSAGFCFGVKRAIDLALKRAREEDKRIYTLGPIIHNPQVVEWLSQKGIVAVEKPPEEGIVLIRTHGAPKGMIEELTKKGLTVIDATCPYVKKAQRLAEALHNDGYQVVILGDEKHPEVKGIKSYAGEDAIVVSSEEDLPEEGLRKKVGIVVQTTRPVSALQKLVSALVGKVSELKVHNTICSSTSERQAETRQIAEKVDVMIVVGGKNSANTKQLARLSESLGKRTYHIETVHELSPEWFNGVRRVGVTAGASTSQWLIDEVVDFLKNLD